MSIKEICRFPDHLPHFLHFSNGADIVVTTRVCKKWHQLIQGSSELIGMITRYFFSQMCHITHGDPSRISTADYYLLADQHFDIRCRQLYQRLILQCAQHHDVIVLTEGFASMIAVPPDREFCVRSEFMLVREYFGVSNVDYVGWDNPKARKKKKEELQAKRLGQEISENFENLCMAIEERDGLSEDSTERRNIQEFITKRLLIDDILNAHFDISLNRESFPARTLSMVETLQQMEKMRIQGTFKRKVKIIVHCGLRHLRIATQDIGVPEFNLDPLYKALEKLNAIVMIPKFLDS